MMNPASDGDGVDDAVAVQAPILEPIPQPTRRMLVDGNGIPLPDALQPQQGDILLAKAFWPWDDLGAQNTPEQWLNMSPRVVGTIAQLAVQTSAGPKLVKAQPDGTLTVGAISLAGQTLNVSEKPQDWLSLATDVFPLGFNILAGADSPVIVPASLVGIRMIRAYIENVIAAAGASVDLLTDTSRKIIARWDASLTGWLHAEFESLVIPANQNIIIHNGGTGTVTIQGMILAQDMSRG